TETATAAATNACRYGKSARAVRGNHRPRAHGVNAAKAHSNARTMETTRNARTSPLLVDVVAARGCAGAGGGWNVFAEVVAGATGVGVVATAVTTGAGRGSTTERAAGCIGAQAT